MSYLTQLKSVGNSLTFQRKKEYIANNFGPHINSLLKKKKVAVLEIGPGLGEFIAYCSENNRVQIDIVELDKSTIRYIQKNFIVRTVFQNEFIWKIDKKLQKYDIVMMTQVLEHIQPKHHIQVLRTIYKHMNVGGKCIITVPNIGNPLASFERYYDYTHHTAFTEHSLQQLIDFASLKNASFSLQGFHIPQSTPVNIMRAFLQKILHSVFKILYIINGGVYPQILTTNISLIIEKTA